MMLSFYIIIIAVLFCIMLTTDFFWFFFLVFFVFFVFVFFILHRTIIEVATMLEIRMNKKALMMRARSTTW